MKLDDIGEFGFIDKIQRMSKIHDAEVQCGIGDDCAVIRISPDLNLLVTTDLLVERVHFLLDWQTANILGAKALAVNLSDIAACGGIPKYAFVSIAVPEHIGIDWLEKFYNGMFDLAEQFHVSILGGDTTRSLTDLVINIAVTGLSKIGETLLRSNAQPGDIIAVSGNLGDSAAGLELLQDLWQIPQNIALPLIHAHLNPTPHLIQGRALAQSNACNAAIDISDGLSSDLAHICKQSGLGATIFEEKLPASISLMELARYLSRNPLEWLLNGGEDYVLLAAIKPHKFNELKLKASVEGWRLIEIGNFESSQGVNLVRASGDKVSVIPKGWDHFKSEKHSKTI
ncbi:MAG: thiamine-phosphate kinase [Desulfomonilaceae bacterium]